MVGLPAVGTASYNGITFDGAYHASIETEPVLDEAQRTVIYLRHTLTIRAVVQANTGVNSTLEELKAKLTKQGQALTFISQGFGNDLIVNVSTGGPRDVKWGPVPKLLRWEPAASSQAADIEWQVTTCVALCNANVYKSRGILALNYEISFRIDAKGWTTRTIAGYLEIAQTRNGRSLPDIADAYRRLINPLPPTGFIREQDYQISKDKSRLDFTITDDEIRSKNAYPAGVVEIRAGHRAHWQRGREAMKLRNSMTADIELAPGAPQLWAYMIFGAMVHQRVDYALTAGGKKRPVFFDELTVEEDIYGYSSRFSASWRVLSGLNELLGGTGLWQPLGTNWNLWKTTLNNSVFHNRGSAKMQTFPQNDAIVDICGGGQQTVPWNYQNSTPTPANNYQNWQLGNDQPPPDQSYLSYHMLIDVARVTGAVRQAVMQATGQDSGNGDLKGTNPFDFGPSQQGNIDDLISIPGSPMYKVRLIGWAVRAGYQIARPRLQKVGAAEPVEVFTKFVPECLGSWFGVPVFRAKWAIDYLLPKSPGVVHARAPLADEGAFRARGAEDPPAPPPPPPRGRYLGPRRHTLWIAPTFNF